ncbi:NADP-dependent malic enzyme [Alphaproteobacteria bacterium HT1-32]|nr:NADP-dependent malic enzyme [Alphaproteobacteria bacterium HT1-32]
MDDEKLHEAALIYHREPKPGKLAIMATKPLTTQRDLSLAYSPGVAAACRVIVEDPKEAATVTARANLVGVVTNGTAVLGLGAIGPLAAKPVMEGKAVLFKKFAGIDVFDIEINETDPHKLIEIIAALEPTFGAINLEDIKSPECFIIEQACRKRMNIPVFHDDQHGTAIVTAAAILNALRITGKKIEDVKLVSTGGGAAGIACLNQLVSLGLKRENVWLCDIAGLVWRGRNDEMTREKEAYAQDSDLRNLSDVIEDADVFLGLSGPNVLKKEMVAKMASQPVILAMANPTPEIWPEDAREVRPDCIIATGRSDYPNQVNNVLCFPFIFRGALDVGATDINEEMKAACVRAIADMAMIESSDIVAAAYGGEELRFGREYLIPKPFDPRLIVEVSSAVAQAAMDSGVATRPIEDMQAYRDSLSRFVIRSGLVMKPIFESARKDPRRVAYAEGEDERVLRAVQTIVDDAIAMPILIGRPEVIASRIEKMGLRICEGRDFEVVNPEQDERYTDFWRSYHEIMERGGVSPDAARTIMRTNTTVIGSMMVRKGMADAMLCGVYGQYRFHLRHVMDVLGLGKGVHDVSALSLLILPQGSIFLCDTHVTPDPSAEEIVEMTVLAANEVRNFGIEPKIALLAHSNFGTTNYPQAVKMREAAKMLHERYPELEVEGEMHADSALNPQSRDRVFPNSRLTGTANLLIFPNLDAANITFNALKTMSGAVSVGPMLIGTSAPAHVLTPSVTARGIHNATAVAVVEAQRKG